MLHKTHTTRWGWIIIRVALALVLIGWGGWTLYQSMIAKKPENPSQPVASAGQPTKKTDAEKAAYSVPADHPRQLIIPTLGINANILSMGVTKEDAVEAPTSAWDAGWYNKSALPGSGKGAMILDGHVNDTLNGAGIFYSISRLSAGDSITVEKGDLTRLQYRVTDVTQLPVDKVDIYQLMRSPSDGLHLITCGGRYIESKKTYDDRVIVTAVRA